MGFFRHLQATQLHELSSKAETLINFKYTVVTMVLRA